MATEKETYWERGGGGETMETRRETDTERDFETDPAWERER